MSQDCRHPRHMHCWYQCGSVISRQVNDGAQLLRLSVGGHTVNHLTFFFFVLPGLAGSEVAEEYHSLIETNQLL